MCCAKKKFINYDKVVREAPFGTPPALQKYYFFQKRNTKNKLFFNIVSRLNSNP